MCVTSPPYYNLRDYEIDGQIGREKTPQEYIIRLLEVFREVKRVLKNLKKLIKNKETLIKKALNVPKLRIEVTDETVSFPWFNETDGDIVKAYTQFIEALCKMAKEVKRVVSKEKPIENEKYAFRCFLLRLGFIGPEYSQSRKLLLKNLEGSSAFKNGGACHAVSEQRSS